MVPKKAKSKRRTIRQQYTARKLYFAKKRKEKKLEKRARKEGKVIPKPRDPGIPNSWPFKEELLQHIQDIKELTAREKAEAKQLRRQQRAREEAIARGEEVPEEETVEEQVDPGVIPSGDDATLLTHIIGNSDVLLEVVDARDAINSRCFSVEKAISSEMPEKIVIMVLTKIDMVPHTVLQQLVNTISPDLPVLCMKNKTLTPVLKRRRRHRFFPISLNKREMDINNFSFGNDYLMECLRSIQKKRDAPINVGVIGYLGVGRHSVIQTITSNSPMYGSDQLSFDKLNNLRRIEKDIHLFTVPGLVVLQKREPEICDYLFKCYSRGYQDMKSREVCKDMLSRVDASKLCYYYQTTMYDSYEELIANIEARVQDKKNMRSTTVPRQILEDWMSNLLPHYAKPEKVALKTVPEDVLKSWKEEIGYEGVKKKMMSESVLKKYSLPAWPRVVITPSLVPEEESLDFSCFLSAAEMEEEDDDEMEDEEDEEEVPELVDVEENYANDEEEDMALLE